MPSESVQKIIGRAIADEAFRELLLGNPDRALAGYELTAEETGALKGLKPEELDALAELEQRVSKTAPFIPGGAVLGP